MNCCFMCTSFQPMNSARSEVTSSMAEYLEKEKLCQEICKTITASVECTDNAITSLNVPNLALLPELNTDDIEGILHQISALLTPRNEENSQASDLEGLNDSRSVEEILKEAENLVRASTPYFERRSSGSASSWSPIPKLINKKYKKNDKVIVKSSETNAEPVTNHQRTIKSVSPLPIEANNVESCDNRIVECEDRTELSEDLEKPIQNRQEVELDQSGPALRSVTPVKSFTSCEECAIESSGIEKALNCTEKSNKLSISDLVTPQPNCTFTLENLSTPERMRKVTTHTNGGVQMTQGDVQKLQLSYEEKLFHLQKQIEILQRKLMDYEKGSANSNQLHGAFNIDKQQLKLLEEEVKSKENLIRDYQRENQRLCNELTSSKALWKETEFRLLEQISQLEQQLKGTVELNNNEVYVLRDKVKGTQENVVCLELAVNMHKNTIRELECTNEELTVDVTRLRCEVEEYKKEIQEWCKKERERVSIVESNAILQSKLSQASTESTKKQAEIVRLNGEVGKLRGELERIRLGSVINQPSEALSITVSQLQSALNLERENVKEILKGKESVTKENLDLKRQVKELETIVKRRVKSGNNLPFVSETPMGTHDNKLRESLEHKNKELEQQIVSYQAELSKNQDKIMDMQAKYDHDIICLEQQLKKVQQENSTLKQSLDENIPKSARRLNSASSMSNAASVKEDAHLLATIRGLKLELGTRDKEIMRLNKELEDTKKTNRRLQKEREKALTTNKARGNSNKDFEKPASLPSTAESAKNYNPALFEDGQETLIFLRAENKNLREEIKRLEQDLISLHNKRIQDLSDLQQEHDAEIAQLLRDHALKHSSSTVAHLQGQLYTQQMVISHLKQQVKVLEENAEEIPILKAERDQLESTLMEANKKIARLHDLASPESVQYSGLLEKLEFLERRHEVREQKLQSIVRDLLARQGQDSVCSSTCRDKLMNKNREICYYRAEMDRILDTLAEFKWSK